MRVLLPLLNVCLLLCVLFLLPVLPGCGKEEEKKSPGTLTLTVSGNYGENFTDGGWATATIAAVATDAEGRNIPITRENISWGVYERWLDERVAAWNRIEYGQLDRMSYNGLSWGRIPFHQKDRIQFSPRGDNRYGDTAYLTDVVGSRTVTVRALLRMKTPEGKWEGDIKGEVTFTFGDGPLSLFSGPPRRVSSRAEAERMCSGIPDSVLPTASQLRLVSDNGKDKYGAFLAAGWPGDYESHDLYNYWTADSRENGKEARVINLKDGFSLWYFSEASGPLAVCRRKDSAPAPEPEEEPSPERAALRAEAEEMLLPRRPNNLVPVPDIWKRFCGSLAPSEKEVPSYYGTPLPAAGLDGCYSIQQIFEDAQPYPLEEVARFDPSTVQNTILLDPSFALFPGMSFRFDNLNWVRGKVSMSTLVRKAREGNPLAALRMSEYFPYDPEDSTFSIRSYFFWVRMADTLTRPGWGAEVRFKVDENIRGLLGWPLDMLAQGGPLLDGVPDGREPFMAWLRECALRGRAFVWSWWAYMYAFNNVSAAHPEGLFEKPDVTRGYAMALAGSRMPLDMSDNEQYAQECGVLAARLERGAPENGLDVERGRALAEELYAVYQENLQRILADQRRHRAEVLPEVNRQIDEWLNELEGTRPKWLKQRWPEYPAYGGRHE